ncbi:MAG: hypothetical protein WD066_06600 [Planctomycetaceae bacterium]
MADPQYEREAVGVRRNRSLNRLAHGLADEILSRIGFDGDEIIEVGGFELAAEPLLIDLPGTARQIQ